MVAGAWNMALMVCETQAETILPSAAFPIIIDVVEHLLKVNTEITSQARRTLTHPAGIPGNPGRQLLEYYTFLNSTNT